MLVELTRIAKRLRITKTALYHYVRNKNELLYLCYQRSVELTEIDAIRDPKPRHVLSKSTAACEARFQDFIAVRGFDPRIGRSSRHPP
jgi:AcrR family transcriptional regulator